jgi:hypothetical protein
MVFDDWCEGEVELVALEDRRSGEMVVDVCLALKWLAE